MNILNNYIIRGYAMRTNYSEQLYTTFSIIYTKLSAFQYKFDRVNEFDKYFSSRFQNTCILMKTSI